MSSNTIYKRKMAWIVEVGRTFSNPQLAIAIWDGRLGTTTLTDRLVTLHESVFAAPEDVYRKNYRKPEVKCDRTGRHFLDTHAHFAAALRTDVALHGGYGSPLRVSWGEQTHKGFVLQPDGGIEDYEFVSDADDLPLFEVSTAIYNALRRLSGTES